MDTVYIYALCEPDLWQEVRYIGASANPQKRLAQHLFNCNMAAENSPKNHWLRGLKAQGLKPILRILGECNENMWSTVEIEWIKQYTSLRLTNRQGNTAYWHDMSSRPCVAIKIEPRSRKDQAS